MSSSSHARGAGGHVSKSERIRSLHSEGRSVSEIADAVGVGYHHAYSVLYQSGLVGKGKTRDAAVGTSLVPVMRSSTERRKLHVDKFGSIVLPEPILHAMGIQGSSEVLARVVDGELRLITAEMAVKRAQKLVRELIPGDESLVDSLIADRRREAAMESSDE